EGDPFEAIVKRQLTMPVPCPTRVDEAGDWGDYLINTVKNSGAKGVIHMVVKYCQPHEMYYPYLVKRLASAGIPSLKLEIEHEVSSLASVKTRIQAFVETLK
ncbi:MAG: 2-hydroxyacyl-CoA dehydratase family protein, partial [Dehalococcoidia bacterium]|nr:2-hydroxyacyl-CoA dehydratase family protein [Dehalococcoidia bacterium]